MKLDRKILYLNAEFFCLRAVSFKGDEMFYLFVMFLSLLGTITSIGVHIFNYFGVSYPFGLDTTSLHIGIFVVWIPAVFVSQSLTRGYPQKDMWKATLRGCPRWMKYSVFVVFGYVIINGLSIFFIIDNVLESDFKRIFSGAWIAFYYVAFATMLSAFQVSNQRK